MASAITLHFLNYRIVRAADDAGGPDGTSRYDVFRPDGTRCCRGVLWADVESEVLADVERLKRHPLHASPA